MRRLRAAQKVSTVPAGEGPAIVFVLVEDYAGCQRSDARPYARRPLRFRHRSEHQVLRPPSQRPHWHRRDPPRRSRSAMNAARVSRDDGGRRRACSAAQARTDPQDVTAS